MERMFTTFAETVWHSELQKKSDKIETHTKKIFEISEWVEGLEDLQMDVMPADCGGTWSDAHYHNHQLSQRKEGPPKL